MAWVSLSFKRNQLPLVKRNNFVTIMKTVERKITNVKTTLRKSLKNFPSSKILFDNKNSKKKKKGGIQRSPEFIVEFIKGNNNTPLEKKMLVTVYKMSLAELHCYCNISSNIFTFLSKKSFFLNNNFKKNSKKLKISLVIILTISL